MNSRIAILICVCVFAFACGSKDKTVEKKDAPVTQAGVHQNTTPKPAAPARSQSVDVWNEPIETPLPPPIPKDPDAVIAQYDSECPNGGDSPKCHMLKLQVERVFLNDLIGLRNANQDVDREWYRIAARSETPQLACLGVRELVYSDKRTPEEDALVVAAIDSPAHGVRGAAYLLVSKLPQLQQMQPRMNYSNRGDSGTCLDDLQDADPGLKWAGGYPNARYRYFASNASLRWFTTTDPVEKVLAYFNNSGHPARTEAELTAAEQANFIAEATKIAQNTNDPNAQSKMLELAQQQGRGAAWIQPVRSFDKAGEIRYVMIGKNQGIAIFKDDVFHATSIVAPMPPPPQPNPLKPDVEKFKMDELAKAIYHF